MNFNDMAKDINANAVLHGWWDEPRTFGGIIALCHSELSEALEEYRARRPMVWRRCENDDPIAGCRYLVGVKEGGKSLNTLACKKINVNGGCDRFSEKPEGIAVELADCVIRILDYTGHKEYNMNLYPMDTDTVPSAEPFEDFITKCHSCLTHAYFFGGTEDSDFMVPAVLHDCIKYIYKWAQDNSVDMDEVIQIKHEFNKTRSYKHGGKVI